MWVHNTNGCGVSSGAGKSTGTGEGGKKSNFTGRVKSGQRRRGAVEYLYQSNLMT